MSTPDEPHIAEPALTDLGAPAPAGGSAPIDALLDVSMPIAIEIGRANMTVEEILQLTTGSVIQLDRAVGEPVDVYVGDRKLALGEVVVIGEQFGVRITRVLSDSRAEAA